MENEPVTQMGQARKESKVPEANAIEGFEKIFKMVGSVTAPV